MPGVLIIFILGMIAGGATVFLFKNIGVSEKKRKTSGRKLIEKQAKEKEENKKRISEFFEKKKEVANDDIEKLLGVSDATVTRYLEELEQEGKIRQVGDIGRGIHYIEK